MAVFEFGESARPNGLIAEIDCDQKVVNLRSPSVGKKEGKGELLCSIPISGYLLVEDLVIEALRQHQSDAEVESALNLVT